MDLGLYQLKYPVRRLISGVLPLVRNIEPDTISWCILPVGTATAVSYYYASQHAILYLLGCLLILLRMFLATLDGLMAVTFNKSSPRGELANRIPAELSDVLLLLALSIHHPRLGPFALAISWLTTFTGLVGLTARKTTQSVGPVGQTDRLTALIGFSLVGFIVRTLGCPSDVMLYFMGWICVGGTCTIFLRMWRTYSQCR